MSSVGVRVGQINLIFCRELLAELPGELSNSLPAICAPLPGGIIHPVEESRDDLIPAGLEALLVFCLEGTINVVSDHESSVRVRFGLVNYFSIRLAMAIESFVTTVARRLSPAKIKQDFHHSSKQISFTIDLFSVLLVDRST